MQSSAKMEKLDKPAKQLVALPRRPAQKATSGRAIMVRANHYKMDVGVGTQGVNLVHYCVMVITNRALPQKALDTEIRIDLPEEDGSTRKNKNEFTIQFVKRGEIDIARLQPFIEGRDEECPYDCLTALNIILNQAGALTYTSINRGLYSPAVRADLRGGIEVWRGYKLSVRPGQNALFLNADLSAAAFYRAGAYPLPFSQLVFDVDGGCDVGPLMQGISDLLRTNFDQIRWQPDVRRRVSHGFKNCKVRVNHKGSNKRQYKFVRIAEVSARDHKFEIERDGKIFKTSVEQYYKEHYGVVLRFPQAPCAQVGPVQKKTMIPIEVLEVPEGQYYRQKLTPDQTSNMLTFTCLKPQERKQFVDAGVKDTLGTNAQGKLANEFMSAFGVNVSSQMAEIPARVLEPPVVTYVDAKGGKLKALAAQDASSGSWNLRDRMVSRPQSLGGWAILNMAGMRKDDADRFVGEFTKVLNATGVKVVQPPTYHNAANPNNLEQMMGEAYNAIKTKYPGKRPQLICIILPDKGTELYRQIKQLGDTKFGIATQCMQGQQCRKASPQYIANVAVKINQKLGGTNQVVTGDHVAFIRARPTMLMGADVTHPPVGMDEKPSIAAVVASMDADASIYWIQLGIQRHKETFVTQTGEVNRRKAQESILDLRSMTKKHLDSFKARNARYPERIIFYRDGVSEGQFDEVLRKEVKAMELAFADAGIQPTLTVVIVQKRHHTRLFPMSSQEGERSGNVRPGTVVDSVITHPTQFDFFLNSHTGLLGTSRPTHYRVIKDQNNFTADAMQKLTYGLCFNYGKATKAVSVCPPAYYAHLAAKRATLFFEGGNWSDSATNLSEAAGDFESQKAQFMSVHDDVAKS
ncbi:hypothetical protein HK101_002392, partial [Irineochytrium annulatum]